MSTPIARIPDLDSLRCFVAAADGETFRAAASVVALSPAAFSERILRLEDLLGERLFDRNGRRVDLTPAGSRLLPEARKALDQARRCWEAVADGARRLPFDLVLGTRYELGLSWLSPALPDLERARPDRRLHLYFGQHGDLLNRLRQGELSAVVTSGRLVEAGLDYAPLHPEDYVFVGPVGPDAPPFAGPADAARLTLVDAAPSLPLFRYLLVGGGPAVDWPWAAMRFLGTIAAIRAAVYAGQGVAVLPRYFVQPDLDVGRLQRLLPDAPLQADAFRLVWRAGDPREAELRDLAEALRALPLR